MHRSDHDSRLSALLVTAARTKGMWYLKSSIYYIPLRPTDPVVHVPKLHPTFCHALTVHRKVEIATKRKLGRTQEQG